MLLIDLPMPEACDVCPLNYDFYWCKGLKDEDFYKYSDDWNEQVCEGKRRPEYCPLKEVVRCKDCKHHGGDACSAGAGIAFPPPDDWFCADGERRTDNGNS